MIEKSVKQVTQVYPSFAVDKLEYGTPPPMQLKAAFKSGLSRSKAKSTSNYAGR